MQESESLLVRAHVVLKKPESDNLFGGRKIAVPDQETREKVRAALGELGLSIKRDSPLSIMIEGKSGQFAEIFHSNVVYSEESCPGGGNSEWSEAPMLPKQLEPYVSEIVFPQSAALDKKAL